MAMVDSDALTQVLSSVDVRMSVARRIELEPAAVLPISSTAVTLVYVAEGIVRGHPPLGAGCRLDVDRSSQQISATAKGDRSRLVTGDALITLGGRQFLLEPDASASLVVFELELSDTARGLATVLPDVITVTDFVGLEPAAAALAANMGMDDPAACALRSGDPVICRMMATTVLLSVIRAWAENGCAPEGWPAGAKDPFLDRVVEAIHEQPGRDWTVELLASVGAMSRSVFAARFRATLGSTPGSYVTEVRMNTAKRMLESGLPVSAIARELGYASDEGFSRAFRRSVGMPPSMWRQTHSAPALA
ncbi:AraC family transcriptional regulator [Microbacterium sp. HD4P20]|uniref:helix-turn-helix domain-containing protein n=1 Tax=Microbacterium sp. HD4P20 TaxID=2864874 RepID=UPI001C6418A0|nr:AraC family transcriptional regulator [Microbacterium sp. HD4P20]MCP2635405.1 AraC family transcriptional regulator [Microbacterium sp. HD4P20]